MDLATLEYVNFKSTNYRRITEVKQRLIWLSSQGIDRWGGHCTLW